MGRERVVSKEQEIWILQNLYYSEDSITGLKANYNSKNGVVHAGDDVFTCINTQGYYQGSVLGTIFLAARIIYFLHHGVWERKIVHIDGNPLNNRITNLQVKHVNQMEPSNGKHHVRGFRNSELRVVWESCFIAQPSKLYRSSGVAHRHRWVAGTNPTSVLSQSRRSRYE